MTSSAGGVISKSKYNDNSVSIPETVDLEIGRGGTRRERYDASIATSGGGGGLEKVWYENDNIGSEVF